MLNDDNRNAVPFPDSGSLAVIMRQTRKPAFKPSVIYVTNRSTDEEHGRASDGPLIQCCAVPRPGARLNCDRDNQAQYHVRWAAV